MQKGIGSKIHCTVNFSRYLSREFLMLNHYNFSDQRFSKQGHLKQVSLYFTRQLWLQKYSTTRHGQKFSKNLGTTPKF